jgi:uncharacterized protein YbjT (DUF2867 family)
MILVTGATGSNGTEIIKRLAGNRAGVRAMVRRKPGPGSDLAGVQYVVADFDDPASVRRALAG